MSEWEEHNQLRLNPTKCQSISFHRSRQAIHYTYHLDSADLRRVSEIKDLGVFLDTKLTFNAHVDRIIAKCRSTLGLVNRFAKDFGDPAIHKTLYCALVRFNLDYASPIWFPYHEVHVQRIQLIQKRFLMSFLGRQRLPGSFALPPYRERLKVCNLDRIEDRHNLACIMVIYDCLMGRIKSPGLKRRIRINNNRRGRRSRYLLEERHRNNYGRFEPLNKCTK